MLRPTSPLWFDGVQLPTSSPLAADSHTRADVCVVGAGIAGMSAAYLLARAGRRVLVLEMEEIGHGQTGRTTAHLANVMDDRFTRLEKLHGEEGSRLAAQSHGRAIDAFENIVREEGIDCDFRRLDGYLFLAPGDDAKTLEAEQEAATRAGLSPRMLERAPLKDFDTGPCLAFADQAQIHPLAFLAGLAESITARDGRIHTGTRVVSVEETDGEVQVECAGGARVTCRELVLATNSPAGKYLAQMKMLPYRTYALAFRVPTGSVPPGLYWDTADPYHYVRLQRREEGEVLIVGGEDHRTGHGPADEDAPHVALEAWTRERFPDAGEVVSRWSGQVLEPADALGFAGRAPGTEHVYFHTGDSGQGMTHGMLAALLVSDLIHGRDNPWAELYAPSRLRVRAIPAYAHEGAAAVRSFLDYLLPGDVSDIEDVPPGEGRVINRGLSPVAVYRDPQGAVHQRSAVCTHMGCVVAWNAQDPGWDCACHGSRFDPYGKVVVGPAVADLGQADLAEAERERREVRGRRLRRRKDKEEQEKA